MGKLVYGMLVSLDGFIEGPNRELDWHVIDAEFHRHVNDAVRSAGAFLHGRRMHELMMAYWPTADSDPSAPDYVVDFARIWKSVPKVVFSRTVDRAEWSERVIRDDVAGEVARLKEERSGDLVVGGATIASTLMRLGLIDEYRLYVQPAVLGSGTPMFPRMERRIALHLVESRRFGSGVMFLRYRALNPA